MKLGVVDFCGVYLWWGLEVVVWGAVILVVFMVLWVGCVGLVRGFLWGSADKKKIWPIWPYAEIRFNGTICLVLIEIECFENHLIILG